VGNRQSLGRGERFCASPNLSGGRFCVVRASRCRLCCIK
jgi:hypothetical protein